MVQVDFHILEDVKLRLKSSQYAATLIEKLYNDKERICVLTDNDEEADRFDTLLWTYKDDSFIPHDIYSDKENSSSPIQICTPNNQLREVAEKTLVNLSTITPKNLTGYKKVIEIVFADPTVQQLARDRFKQYRDQGYELNTYKIKA